MHVAIACGGTGGHIFPGLATADELVARGHRVTLWLAGKDVEHEAVSGWKGDVVTVPAQGFPSSIGISSVKTGFKLVGAIRRVKAMMAADPPDVVLAMGSYASIGPGIAAILRGTPLVLHESNVIPGRAVRLLSAKASAIGCCFSETRFHLKRKELVITGMPLRASIVEWAEREAVAWDRFRFLIMGGSRGARRLNELATQAIIDLHRGGLSVAVTHLTGTEDRDDVAKRYSEGGVEAETLAFTNRVGELYRNCDFAICRAGAATCAELSTLGLPSLLVPYPFAINDHQTANARAMEKEGAADMVPEADLNLDWLTKYLRQMIVNRERRAAMSAAALARSSVNGAAELAALVESRGAKA